MTSIAGKTQSTPATIQAAILTAAEKRFREYGYGKTTMVEIASDVNMSAANLYRYFRNKQDIAAACAHQSLSDLRELLRRVVEDPSIDSGGERLRRFVRVALHFHYQLMHDAPRLNELVNSLTRDHPELIYTRNLMLEELIAEILVHGNSTGEFDVTEPERTAMILLKALVVFTSPYFMHLYSLAEFERMADAVVTLLIDGIRPQ